VPSITERVLYTSFNNTAVRVMSWVTHEALHMGHT
jgi:hypothetical protein